MKIYSCKLIERIKRTPTIESFRFMPYEKIEFSPGQFLQVIFDTENLSNSALNKYLSFSSSPTKAYIEVTKRLSDSDFSRRLNNLNVGDIVSVKAPLGSCIFKEEYEKIGFLIGGIGITPAISIIEYLNDKKMDTDVVLFYSNRTEDEIAFKLELDSWKSGNKNIKVYYTITDCQPKDNSCAFGYIDKKLVQENDVDLTQRRIFIYGPGKMVEAMSKLGGELACREGWIKTETFIGY